MSSQDWTDRLTGRENALVEKARQAAGNDETLRLVAKLAEMLDAAEKQPERRPELFTGNTQPGPNLQQLESALNEVMRHGR